MLLDIDTGERAPFFAETDANFSDPAQSALIIRPLARLHPKSHYAVAIRTAVKAADGSALESPPGFIAMRDGGDFNHPLFGAVKAGANAMFTALDTAGVPKSDIVLAWDFETASDEFLQAGPDHDARCRGPGDGRERREPDVQRAGAGADHRHLQGASRARTSRPTSSPTPRTTTRCSRATPAACPR